MMRLEPCPSCKRHVKLDEVACPFCRSALGDAFRAAPARPRPLTRLGSRAGFAFSLSIAAACGGKDTTDVDAGADAAAVGGEHKDAGVIVILPPESTGDPVLHVPDAAAPQPDDAGSPVDYDDVVAVPIYRAAPP
jgi:hypothetical protein